MKGGYPRDEGLGTYDYEGWRVPRGDQPAREPSYPTDRPQRVKAPPYDGSTPWEDYVVQFELIAELNEWDERTKALQLAASLRGKAQAVLADLEDGKRRKFSTLVDSLVQRFGRANQTELFRTLLRNRSRQSGETIPELAHDIQRLLSKAYPKASVEMKETLAKEAFIDASGDSDIRWKIYQARPKSLKEAVCIATELEAFNLAEQKKGVTKRLGVRRKPTYPQEKPTKSPLLWSRLGSVGARGLYVRGELEGVAVKFLIDTGADLTVIRTSLYERLSEGRGLGLENVSLDMAVADGRPLPFKGRRKFHLKVGGLEVTHDIWVADIDIDAILGYDFLQKYNCTIDAGKGKVTIGTTQQDTDMVEIDAGRKVVVAKTVVVPPGSEKMVAGRIRDGPGPASPVVIECTEKFVEHHHLMAAKVLVDPSKDVIPLRLMNPSDRPITLYEGTVVGECHSAEIVKGANPETVNCRVVTEKTDTGRDPNKIQEHLRELAEKSCEHLTDAEGAKVRELLINNADVFARSKEDLGRTDLVQHTINTGTAKPIRQPPRRLPIHHKGEAEEQIQKMLKNDVIEPSASAWASPVVLVRKKDGSTRFCVDYRKLNEVTEKDSYPLPRIDDTLDTLAGSKWFCTLDLASGYWQVEVKESDQPKTAFVTYGGLYQFKVLPFGLCNAPATFERLMERVLKGLQWQTCLLYLDDVIVHGNSLDKTLNRLNEVLQRMREAKLKLNPKKCHLFQPKVSYLGHVVSSSGIAPNPDNVKVVVEWPTPCSITDVRRFVGVCSYYRRFVQGFSQICTPLFRLTEKGKKFEWRDECELAFTKLKQALTSAPILAYPEEKGTFVLDTDASDFGIGSVLSQQKEGSTQETVVAYFSKALSKAEKSYCVTRKELLAVIASVKHFHHYLYGARFIVRTDHGALRWLTNFKNPEGQLARWLETLSTYDFELKHRPGRLHGNADAMSRRPADAPSRRPCVECKHCDKYDGKDVRVDSVDLTQGHIFVLGDKGGTSPDEPDSKTEDTASNESNESTSWFQRWTSSQLRELQLNDKDIGPILLWKEVQHSRPDWEQITTGSAAMKNYWGQWDRLEVIEGVLYRRFESDTGQHTFLQLLVPKKIQEKVLDQAHNHKLSGHLLAKKSLARIRERFYWSGYRRHVENWCKSCDDCASRKGPTKKVKSKMKLYGAGHPMQRCALDIMGPLPMSNRGNRYVLVIADYFTKWTEAYGIPDMEAVTVARILVEEFICRFGVPDEIHTDQGRQFESGLFQHLCRLLDIKKTRTTPFHPQSDGMVERFNRTLECMLSLVVAENQQDWDTWLPYLMMAYRSAEHESTKFSPAEVIFGRRVNLPLCAQLPKLPDHHDSPRNSVPKYVKRLEETLYKIHEMAQEYLQKAGTKQKKFHDRRTSDQVFNKGDFVWLMNSNKKKGLSPKLRRKWIGPGLILKRVTDVVYRVKMGPKRRPQVVHCDRLKPYLGDDPPLWLIRHTKTTPAAEAAPRQPENQ
ncbi:hypothetical protein HOLleu_44301 [Holothuria leucospilota]|uniref:Endonuclease n=1 Tax=Holothuria leucospilota TaxID=206669 RepID=A0A9Q0YDG4_HOLLE|nr:hypothetical protein HOLleu_44301 [Holothuria leucospilota]